MKRRIVRPAILSIMGVYSPIFLAVFPLVPGTWGVGGIWFAVVGFAAIVAGVWLSTTSGLLLLDTVRHRIWGPIVALSYVIAIGPLYFFSQLLRGLVGLSRFS